MKTDFEVWYARYPRKIGRAAAFRAWQKTAGARPPLPVMLAALDAMMRWREQLAVKRDFVPALPYPATYLHEQRWEDEFDVVAAPVVTALPLDPRVVEQREAERMAVMRARAAWSEVVHAARSASLPLCGWADTSTAEVLSQVGGLDAVRGVASRAALNALALRFEQAWMQPGAAGASGNVVTLRRVANG